MNESNGTNPDHQAEAVKFLERDFNQCFTQMRHHDGQIWDICKFSFTAYTALLGVAIGLYRISVDKQVDLIPAALTMLAVGAILGFFMLLLIVRHRVYFVRLARYVNEHRRLYLSKKPLEFENESGMYTNPGEPRFFSWQSWQLWLSCIIATLNSLLLAVLVFIPLHTHWSKWLASVGAFLAFLVFQIIVVVSYLRSREES